MSNRSRDIIQFLQNISIEYLIEMILFPTYYILYIFCVINYKVIIENFKIFSISVKLNFYMRRVKKHEIIIKTFRLYII